MSTKITKLEHSSLLLEHKNNRILFDPGAFSKKNEHLHNIDLLLFTHQHGDHLDMDNLKYIKEHSPNLHIITNSEITTMIKDLNIKTNIVEGTGDITIKDVKIAAHDHPHEELYKTYGAVQNTGYYIDDVFFHPGDSYTSPTQQVKSIATVISGPFMNMKMAIEYINAHPDHIHIGVHDAVANPGFLPWLNGAIQENLNEGNTYQGPNGSYHTLTL